MSAAFNSLSNFQTTRNIIASLDGLQSTVESVTEAEDARISDVIEVIKGDGTNQTHDLHDPAFHVKPVTLEIIVERNRAFVAYALSLKTKHKLNPRSAGPLTIRSYDDDGSVVDSVTLTNAVIQSVSLPMGSTMQHKEAVSKVVVKPSAILAG